MVARAAGVSVATVSNYLNGRHNQMSAATRARIQAAIDELGYRPNHIARSLVTRRTVTIGLVISELTNSLYPPVLLGVEAVLRSAGYGLLLANASDIESEKKAIKLMLAKQIDGLIMFSVSFLDIENDHLFMARESGLPVVVINRALPQGAPITQVQLNNIRGGYVATRHLLELGHRRIAHIAGPSSRFTGRDRRAGYLAALAEFGIAPDPALIVEGEYSFESGYQAIRRLLPHGPTAIFVGGDAMALGALRALSELGIRVPGDLSLVAYGDPDFVRFATPAITTVHLPIVEAGRVAAELLLEAIAQPDSPPVIRVLEPQLVVRSTTAPPPG